MSSDALSWAKLQTVGSANRKLVLLLLADYADEAWSCFPGQARIAAETELGERTIRRLLEAMEADGWIRRERRNTAGGHRTSDRIYIVRDREGATSPTGQPGQAYRPTTTGPTGQAVAGEPSVEPPVEPAPQGAADAAPLPGLDDPQTTSQPVDEAEARDRKSWRLIRQAYETRTRKPIENRRHVARTVARLLEAGWTEPQLSAALLSAPAWTPTSLQVELTRAGGAPRRPPANRPPADDPRREGESRVVDVAEEMRRARR